MAYNEDIAERIRKLTSAEPGVSERKMFGGLAFLIGGNLAVAASGQGGILVRVDPERSDSLAAATDAETAVMRGREMRGWLRVDSRTCTASNSSKSGSTSAQPTRAHSPPSTSQTRSWPASMDEQRNAFSAPLLIRRSSSSSTSFWRQLTPTGSAFAVP